MSKSSSGSARPSTVGGHLTRDGYPKKKPLPAPIALHPPVLIQHFRPSPSTGSPEFQFPRSSPTPANSPIPATQHTADRGRRFRSLVKSQPLLPLVIHNTISEFRSLSGTRDRSVVMKIFLYLTESFTEDDPILKQRLVDLALDEVAFALQIDRCIIETAKKTVGRCCRDRFSCCFPCL